MKKLLLLLSVLFVVSCSKDPVMYTLTVQTIPNDGGLVNPLGGTVNAGDQISVTQTPNQEFIFKNWSGAASGTSNSVTVIMDSDKTLTANYVKKKYPLTISVEGEGTVTEKVIKAGTATDYNSGTILELTAVPSSEWEFVEWTGDLTGTENPKQITISSPKSVKAKFKISNPFYFDDNNITVKAKKGVVVGEIGILNGITYKAVDKGILKSMIFKKEDLSKVVTTLVTNMDELFRTNSEFNQNISSWDVSNVNSMKYLFSGATIFNQDISIWDVSKVTDMTSMLGHTKSFDQPIGNWDVSSVTDMYGMFIQSSFNQELNNWNVSKVTNMNGMFASSQFNKELSNWDVSSVTDMSGMFSNFGKVDLTFNNNSISGWNVSKVTNMNSMFYDSPFNQDISNWDVSNVTVMKSMFKKSSFNQSINNWNTSKVTNMQGMFAESEFNKPIGKWDVSKVTEMTIMFKNAINFNQDLTKWCVKYLAVPQDFSTNSPLIESNKPIWGTCPVNSYTIAVTSSSNADYTLSGEDRNGDVSGNDPGLTFKVGDEVTFSVNADGHPFYLKTVAGTGTDNQISGVTNNGTSKGSIVWTPTAAGTYYYQCSAHSGMVGTITIE